MSTAQIPMSARYQFPWFETAADYTAATGLTPPAPNPAWPLKRWFDPAAKGQASVSYQFWNGSVAAPALMSQSMTGDEADAVNFPGSPSYPPYSVAPTPATRQLIIGTYTGLAVPIDPTTLSTLAQTQALAALIPGATVGEPSAVQGLFVYTWGAETRRDYTISSGNGQQGPYVGQLLQQQNAGGVGAPGSWSTANGQYVWVPAPANSSVSSAPELLPPLALQPGEELASTAGGGGIFLGPFVQAAGTTPVTPSTDMSAVLQAISDLKAWLVTKIGA